MGKFYDSIPTSLIPWLQAQPLFFVGTAPLAGGNVNCSPKATEENGCVLLHVLDEHRVRYLDLTGSGNETVSHLREEGNGRITVMWMNLLEGAPRIVRIFGKGTVHERMDPNSAFSRLAPPEAQLPVGVRALIDIELHMCSTSCGYTIPIFAPVRERRALLEFAHRQVGSPSAPEHDGIVDNGLGSYWINNNTLSIDGLPGLASFQAHASESEQVRLLERRQLWDRKAPPAKALDAASDRPWPRASLSSAATTAIAAPRRSTWLKSLLLAFILGLASDFPSQASFLVRSCVRAAVALAATALLSSM